MVQLAPRTPKAGKFIAKQTVLEHASRQPSPARLPAAGSDGRAEPVRRGGNAGPTAGGERWISAPGRAQRGA